jgi:hypothetical protein
MQRFRKKTGWVDTNRKTQSLNRAKWWTRINARSGLHTRAMGRPARPGPMWCGGLVLFVNLAGALAQPAVVISSVNPSRGSLVGGTRMHIRGTGFSNNMGGLCCACLLFLLICAAAKLTRCCAAAGSQIVFIGDKYRCDVISLHSTVSQIACKTTSALDGTWRMHDNGEGWTGPLEVRVAVDGRVSTCLSEDAHGCTFEFRNTNWWNRIKNTPEVR